MIKQLIPRLEHNFYKMVRVHKGCMQNDQSCSRYQDNTNKVQRYLGDPPMRSVNSDTPAETLSLLSVEREDENYDDLMSEGERFARNEEQGENDSLTDDSLSDQSLSYANTLRVVKVISLLLIGAIALFGMIFSKISFVSITTRMYSLYTYPNSTETNSAIKDNQTLTNYKSAIFFQLVVILVIPEIVSLLHCLIKGFLGKSSITFPWPNWKSIALVSS